jgi:hypothetical protein
MIGTMDRLRCSTTPVGAVFRRCQKNILVTEFSSGGQKIAGHGNDLESLKPVNISLTGQWVMSFSG